MKILGLRNAYECFKNQLEYIGNKNIDELLSLYSKVSVLSSNAMVECSDLGYKCQDLQYNIECEIKSRCK